MARRGLPDSRPTRRRVAPLAGWTATRTTVRERGSNGRARPLPGAQVAQLVEHVTENHGVGGSIPPLGTISPLPVRRTGEHGDPSIAMAAAQSTSAEAVTGQSQSNCGRIDAGIFWSRRGSSAGCELAALHQLVADDLVFEIRRFEWAEARAPVARPVASTTSAPTPAPNVHAHSSGGRAIAVSCTLRRTPAAHTGRGDPFPRKVWLDSPVPSADRARIRRTAFIKDRQRARLEDVPARAPAD